MHEIRLYQSCFYIQFFVIVCKTLDCSRGKFNGFFTPYFSHFVCILYEITVMYLSHTGADFDNTFPLLYNI